MPPLTQEWLSSYQAIMGRPYSEPTLAELGTPDVTIGQAPIGYSAGTETEETIFNGEAEPPQRIPGVVYPGTPSTPLEPIPWNRPDYVEPGTEIDTATPLGAINGIVATPVIAPIAVAGVTAIIRGLIIRFGGRLSIGVFKQMVRKWGALAVKVAVGVLAFNEFMDLIGLGASDETMIDIKLKKRKKRYTIGHNPRVVTLQRVARHTMKLLKRHRKYIDEFLPVRKKTYGIPPARALSAIERAAIKATG